MSATGVRASIRYFHRRLILIVLLIILALVFSERGISFQPGIAAANTPQQLILYVHDSSASIDPELFANTTLTLNYARINYDTLDLATVTLWPRLDQYSAILFMTDSMHKISQAQVQQIIEYTANGGAVIVAYRGWNDNLAPLFGFKAGTEVDFTPPDIVETGMHFVADFFPGVQGLALSKEIVPLHTLLEFQWPPDAPEYIKVIATTNSGRPVAWTNRYGQGRTIFWNTDFLGQRDARGFIIQSIMNVQPVGVQPIANFATFQVDDFPAAVSTQKLEPIKAEYNLNMVDFYNQVWIPDMQEISDRFNIPYTFFLPFNYNGKKEPPFDFREWEHAKVTIDEQQMPFSVFATHLLAQNHEIGLHGYNHNSLLIEPNFWIPEDDSQSWLRAKALLTDHELVSAWETRQQLAAKAEAQKLTPEEQASKTKAEQIIDQAVTHKLEEAEAILFTNAQVDEPPNEQELAEAEQLLSVSKEEVAAFLVNEARADLAEADETAVAEATAAMADMEQMAENNMRLALVEAAQRWEADNLGPWPVSYVPPNNIFRPAGTRVLYSVFPSLKIMAGIYFGEFERGGAREFGPEPWNRNFYSIPRVTAEYTLTSENRFLVISMLSLMGVMTHFVHPDDVYHTPQNYPLLDFHRNPNALPWRGDHTGQKNGFYYHMVEWLEFNQTFYPWLRYTRTDESYDILKTHLENQINVGLSSESLSVTSDEPSYFLVRINNGQRIDLTAMRGVQFLHVYQGEDYRLYALRGVKTDVELTLLPADNHNVQILPVEAIPWSPSLPADEESVLNLQGTELWLPPPIPTPGSTPTATPTATPGYDLLPIPTPTLRNRP